MLHAGLDLSRRKVDVCLLSEQAEIVEEAQRAYERTVKDWQQNTGASGTAGRASDGSSREHVARQTPRPKSAL